MASDECEYGGSGWETWLTGTEERSGSEDEEASGGGGTEFYMKNAEQWAEEVSKAASAFVSGTEGEERMFRRAAFVAGATFALIKTGVVDVEICNAFAHRCDDI